MNKKISLGAAIAFMLIVATAAFSMTMIYATSTFNKKVVALKERERQFEKFSEIDRQVRQKYNGTINETTLMDSVAKGYLAGLNDPYATYIDARTYERMLRAETGSLAGIGATFASNVGDGYLTVQEVLSDSPAQASGLEVGDVVVKIDDTALTRENSAQMLDAIQDEPGTRVTLVVRRGGEEVTLPEMTRRIVEIQTVFSTYFETSGVAYMRIAEFSDKTSDQFNRELQRMISAGAQSIIFDLRDNSGGNLRQAIRMLDRLLPTGTIASYQKKDSENGENEVFTSDANEITLPMVTIINSGSASASELFAQALREYEKARIVGQTSVGKGVVQEVIKLNDGSAISITVAELLGPSGETFNRVGVKPDYEVLLDPDMQWTDYAQEEDPQLLKALEVAVSMHPATDPGDAQQPDDPAQTPEPPAAPPDTSEPESSAEAPAGEDESGDGGDEESEAPENGEGSGNEATGADSEA